MGTLFRRVSIFCRDPLAHRRGGRRLAFPKSAVYTHAGACARASTRLIARTRLARDGAIFASIGRPADKRLPSFALCGARQRRAYTIVMLIELFFVATAQTRSRACRSSLSCSPTARRPLADGSPHYRANRRQGQRRARQIAAVAATVGSVSAGARVRKPSVSSPQAAAASCRRKLPPQAAAASRSFSLHDRPPLAFQLLSLSRL